MDATWGDVKAGETVAASAIRELSEETGIVAKDAQRTFSLDADTTFHDVSLAPVADDLPINLQTKEIKDSVWWDGDTPLPLSRSTRTILSEVLGRPPAKTGSTKVLEGYEAYDWWPRRAYLGEMEGVLPVGTVQPRIDQRLSRLIMAAKRPAGVGQPYLYLAEGADPVTRGQILRANLHQLLIELGLRPRPGVRFEGPPFLLPSLRDIRATRLAQSTAPRMGELNAQAFVQPELSKIPQVLPEPNHRTSTGQSAPDDAPAPPQRTDPLHDHADRVPGSPDPEYGGSSPDGLDGRSPFDDYFETPPPDRASRHIPDTLTMRFVQSEYRSQSQEEAPRGDSESRRSQGGEPDRRRSENTVRTSRSGTPPPTTPPRGEQPDEPPPTPPLGGPPTTPPRGTTPPPYYTPPPGTPPPDYPPPPGTPPPPPDYPPPPGMPPPPDYPPPPGMPPPPDYPPPPGMPPPPTDVHRPPRRIDSDNEIPNTGGHYPATIIHDVRARIETDLDTGHATASILELPETPRVNQRQPEPASPKKIKGRNIEVDVLSDGSLDIQAVHYKGPHTVKDPEHIGDTEVIARGKKKVSGRKTERKPKPPKVGKPKEQERQVGIYDVLERQIPRALRQSARPPKVGGR